MILHTAGLACRLLHIGSPEQIATHPLRGPLVETWCVGESRKARRHRGLPADLWFWRSHDGVEVDLVLDRCGSFGISASATPGSPSPPAS